MAVNQLRIYPYIKGELDTLTLIITKSGLDALTLSRVLNFWVTNRDFTIIALFAKPPRYIQGVKKYAEYYADYNSLTGTFPSESLVVRKDFTDIVVPKMWSLFVQALPGAEQITLQWDRTAEIEVNDQHSFIDGSDGQTFKGSATVTAVSTDGSTTTVTYDSLPAGVVLGDVCYFPKGQVLGGIDIKFQWYNNLGEVQLEKTERKYFGLAASGEYELKRRERSVTHMVASSLGTDVEEVVAVIKNHYETEINGYIKVGDWQTWTTAIDNDVAGASGPTIQAYLAIQIPFTDIEGNTTIKPISEWIKDEMYKSY